MKTIDEILEEQSNAAHRELDDFKKWIKEIDEYLKSVGKLSEKNK